MLRGDRLRGCGRAIPPQRDHRIRDMMILAKLQKQCEAMQQQLADFAQRLATQNLRGQEDSDHESSASFESLFTKDTRAEESDRIVYGEPRYDEYTDDYVLCVEGHENSWNFEHEKMVYALAPCIQEANIHSKKTTETKQCSRSSPTVEEAEQKDIFYDNQFSYNRSPQYNLEQSSDSSEVLKAEQFQALLGEKMPVHSMSAVEGEIKLDSSLKFGISAEVTNSKLGPSRLSDSDECSDEKVVLRIPVSAINIQHQHLTRRIWDPGAGVDSRTSPFQPEESDAGAYDKDTRLMAKLGDKDEECRDLNKLLVSFES